MLRKGKACFGDWACLDDYACPNMRDLILAALFRPVQGCEYRLAVKYVPKRRQEIRVSLADGNRSYNLTTLI
jgi:hypothetical protein